MSRRDMRTIPLARAGVAGGFTLVEVMVIVSIIALLVTILAPVVGQAVELGRRAKCATNLKAILKGCQAYSLDKSLHRGASVAESLPYKYFDSTNTDWFGSDGNKASLWLLIKCGYGTGAQFVCPADKSCQPAKSTADKFQSGTFGYAFQSQLGQSGILRLHRNNLDSSRVLVADKNPRFPKANSDELDFSMDEKNSQVHRPGGVGQNVGRADMSVQFLREAKVSTGKNRQDWIYQSDQPGSDAAGMSRGDDGDEFEAIDDVFLVN